MAAPGGIIEPPAGLAGTPAPGADGIDEPGGIIELPPGELAAGIPGADNEPGIDGADGIEGMLGVFCASNPAGASVMASADTATVMVFMKPG